MRRFHNQPLLSPSDLNDLLECHHLMALKLAAFEKRPGPRPTHGAHTEILVRYGGQHEQAILERFVWACRIRRETGCARPLPPVAQLRSAQGFAAVCRHPPGCAASTTSPCSPPPT